MSPQPPDNVLMVVEQLRRRVPGGAGTYAAGLLSGLRQLADDAEPVPSVTLFASRARRDDSDSDDSAGNIGRADSAGNSGRADSAGNSGRADSAGNSGRADSARQDRLTGYGFPVIESRLPGPLLTRAWGARIARAPSGFRTLHATSLAVPPARGVRTVATVHDLAWRHVPFAYPRHGLRWHEKALGDALRRRFDLVVPSRPVADELKEAGADPSHVTVIEPGGDHLPAPDFEATEGALERIGVNGPFILSVSTLEPRKNLDALMEAYSIIRGSLPGEWPLVVVGPAGWGPGVTGRDGVVLAGAVTEGVLSGLYAKAEMLAYVPLVEGFGLPPLEAMQAGTPVVASPIPSTGGAALEVDPLDTEEIAQGLLAMATDSALRDKLVEAGRAHAALLSWKMCAKHHVELWHSDPKD